MKTQFVKACVVAAQVAALVTGQTPAPGSFPQFPPLPAQSPVPPVNPSLQVLEPGKGRTLGIVEAVQLTLKLNPLLHIQERQVDINRGSLLIQSSIFDTNLGSTFNQGKVNTPLQKTADQQAKAAGLDVGGAQTTDQTSTNINGGKLFRSGIQVNPTIQLNRAVDNLQNQTGLNNSQVSVQVVLPLLRNRGRAAVASQEIAAGVEVEASNLDLSQTASSLIGNTASAYWNYLGALEALAVYRESETRGNQLMDGVRAMIAADVLPRAEYQTALANVASRAASRINAEQQVVQAAQSLALAIGVTADQIMTLPPPGDEYPDPATALFETNPEAIRRYIQLALSRRGDYLAGLKRIDESGALLVGARNQLRPQFDVVLNFGYAGLQETNRIDKYLSSVFQNVHGPNATGGLTFNFPIENRRARGSVLQNEASMEQNRLRATDVARNIASNVVNAATSLNSSALQLQQAAVSSRAFKIGLEGEREKLRLGAGSLLDILQEEDRYISATLNEISARVAYAAAIANFRVATGTYIVPNQPVQSVAREAFYIP